jgi:hypothetical protein
MKALDYLDMPSIVYNRYEVELSQPERKLYDQLGSDLLIPLSMVMLTPPMLWHCRTSSFKWRTRSLRREQGSQANPRPKA